MRKLFLLFWALLATTCLWAHDFKVDGIYYNCLDGNNVAVTYKGSSYYSSAYSGEVTIPETVTYDGTTYSVTSIGMLAFHTCSKLTSITIPNSVTSIGDGAFFICPSLTSITIPNSVTSIGNEAFDAFFSLTSMVVEEGNTTYDSRDNCNAIIETATNTLIAGCQNTIIPNSVTSIGDWAFSDCSSLTSVTIPNSVTSIGNGAFSRCYSLTSVTIGNGVTSIGEKAFYNCSSLTSVTIPNSVTSIGNSAFEYCRSLTSITIPNSVTCIGERAFSWCSKLTSLSIGSSVTNIGEEAFYKCSKLTSITCEATTPPVVGTDAFHKLSRKMPVIVPDESVDAYKSAPVWQDFNIQGKSTYIADKGKTKNHRR